MSAESTRSDLLQQLRELGVESVTAEYNGSRDEGQIETPEFGPTEVPDDVVTAAEHLFYELLERLYSGWEDNEGAFGQFRWDVGDAGSISSTTRGPSPMRPRNKIYDS